MIWQILSITLCVYILIKFYSKKRIVPVLMIIFYSGSVLNGLIDFVILEQIPLVKEVRNEDTILILIKSTITSIIWIPYFLKSVRVKNTFVN